MARAAVSPAQQQRTQLQLLAAATVKAKQDTIALQLQVAEVEQSVSVVQDAVVGLDVEAINETLSNYEDRIYSLENPAP